MSTQLQLRPVPNGDWAFSDGGVWSNDRRTLPARTLLEVFASASSTTPSLVLDLVGCTARRSKPNRLELVGEMVCEVESSRRTSTAWTFGQTDGGLTALYVAAIGTSTNALGVANRGAALSSLLAKSFSFPTWNASGSIRAVEDFLERRRNLVKEQGVLDRPLGVPRAVSVEMVAWSGSEARAMTLTPAIAGTAEWITDEDIRVVVTAQPRLALYEGNAPPYRVRVLQALVPRREGFRPALSVLGFAGGPVLRFWNEIASTDVDTRRSSNRATFVPRFPAAPTNVAKTGRWAITAVDDALVDRYAARAIHPIAAAVDSTTVALAGVTTHAGGGIELDVRVTGLHVLVGEKPTSPAAKKAPTARNQKAPASASESTAVVPPDPLLASLQALAPLISEAALDQVGGSGAPAQIAFRLLGGTAAKPREYAVRFDEFDVQLTTGAGNGGADRPLIDVATGSVARFLDATPGLTKSSVLALLTVTDLRPGGDGLAGRRSASDDVAPALVVPLTSGDRATHFDLQVTETPRFGAVDTLIEAALQQRRGGTVTPPGADPNGPPPRRKPGRAIVLGDRPAFLFAVTYPALELSATDQQSQVALATWRFDPNPSAGRSGQRGWVPGAGLLEQGRFDWTLNLPAQGIGEETERVGTLRDRAGTPLDFRIGEPGRINLSLPAAAPGVNRLFPWNAFRIFLDPLNAQGSPTLQSAQLELLFGMSCDIRSGEAGAAFVVVDPVRRLGMLPLALTCALPWVEASAAHKKAFREAAERWRKQRLTYTSRLLLLEPVSQEALYRWDPVVLPSSRVSCTVHLPASRDLASPIDESPAIPRPGMPVPLRGGALWGIEQAPIFRGLFEKKGGNGATTLPSVTSVDAMMSELALSSFGGSGHVEASFPDANALPGTPPGTRIAADVSYGNLTRYLVTRRGRIGVFGHPALHVSVYERSTVPSEQFGRLQPTFLTGRAVVRKVAEYVEVSAPVARLANPDSDLSQAGFVSGCAFQPGARIPVRSDWGSDVGGIGWKVPLWNRAAAGTQPHVYPRPDVSLLLTMEQDPRGSELERRERGASVLNPDVLCFFTRTDGVDPASRELVEGIDFTPLPAPLPQRTKVTGDPVALERAIADDPEVPTGFERFTFEIEPGDDPVLISANRGESADGVRARVRTVTVVRGPVYTKDDVPPAYAQWARRVEAFGDLPQAIEQVGTGLEAVASAFADATEQELGGITRAALLKLTVGTPVSTPVSWPPGVDAAVGRRVEAFRSQYVKGLETLGQQRAALVAARTDKFATDATQELAAVTGFLRQEVESEIQRLVAEVRRTVDERLAALVEPLRRAASAAVTAAEAVGAYDNALAGIRELLLDNDPDKLRLELERIARVYLEATEVWALGIETITTMPAARAWLDGARARGSNAGRQLAASRPEWATVLGPLCLQFDVAAGAALQAVEQAIAARDPAAARSAAEAAVGILRKDIADRLISIAYPNLAIPPAGVNVWAATRAAMLREHELFRRLRPLVDAARATVAAWPDQMGLDAARQLELLLRREVLEKLVDHLAQAAGRASLQAAVLAEAETLLSRIAAGLADGVSDAIVPLRAYAELAEQQLDALLASGRDVEAAVRELRDRGRAEARALVAGAASELRPYVVLARAAQTGARLLRSLGDPPTAQDIAFVQSRLAYVFPPNDRRVVQLSTTVARIGQTGRKLGEIDDRLKAVGLDLPVEDMRDALLKPAADMLGKYDFNKIFHDLGGMKLGALFKGLKMPELPDQIRVRHEIDPLSRRARVHADIQDLKLAKEGGEVPVLDLGVFALALRQPKVNASVSIESVGMPPQPRQQMRGSLSADWVVRVAGSPVVTLSDTRIEFAQPGGLHFDIDPTKIELAEVLQFLTDLLDKAGSEAGGLIAGLSEKGFEAVLSSELPAITAGTFAITNLSLGVRFALEREAGKFVISVGTFVGRRRAPFALTVFILGGGGFLEIDARYVVGGAVSCRVALGINAAATVGVALGPIRGTVFAALGFALYYESSRGGGLRFELFFLLRGTVRILSLITVMLELELSLTYSAGVFVGTGVVRVTIKIGFFKKRLSAGVRYRLGCVSPDSEALHNGAHPLFQPLPEERVLELARTYVSMYE